MITDWSYLGLPPLAVNTIGFLNSHLLKYKNSSVISLVRMIHECLALLTIFRLIFNSSGWTIAIGWQVYLAGVCFMAGTVIQGLIALNVQDYVWQPYHGTLLTIAIIVFSIAFNTVLAAQLPLLEGIVLILHLAGILAIIIPLWVMAPRASASDAILTFSNNGGWSSTGLSSMIGLTAPLSVLIGFDCSVHMCKSIVHGSISPKILLSNSLLSF